MCYTFEDSIIFDNVIIVEDAIFNECFVVVISIWWAECVASCLQVWYLCDSVSLSLSILDFLYIRSFQGEA